MSALTIQAVSPVNACLDSLLGRFAPLVDGVVASYIPELAGADPALFGICIATLDGSIYEAGDTRVPFTTSAMISSSCLAMTSRSFRHSTERSSGARTNCFGAKRTRPRRPKSS